MRLQALKSFVWRDTSTGALTSYAKDQIFEADSTPGGDMKTAGLAADYTLIAPTGKKTITENATGIDVAEYATADVNVPNPSTGNLEITENGENIDVTQYASVTVNVTTTPAETEG